MSEITIAKKCLVLNKLNEFNIIETSSKDRYDLKSFRVFEDVSVYLVDGVLKITNITQQETTTEIYISNFVLRNSLLKNEKKVL